MAIIKHNGETVAIMHNPQSFLDELAADGQSTEGYSVEYTAHESRALKRHKIYTSVADIDSLLGTTTDAAQVLVLFASADAVALAHASDFAAYKKSRMDALAALSGGADGAQNMVAKAQELLTGVQNGSIIMPFLAKPDKASGVFKDLAERATGVAKALSA